MAKFTMKLNHSLAHPEHDWIVEKDGQFLAGFAGSNAAERFLIEQEAHDMNLISEAMARGLSASQFADLAKRMDGDKAKILTVLRGL